MTEALHLNQSVYNCSMDDYQCVQPILLSLKNKDIDSQRLKMWRHEKWWIRTCRYRCAAKLGGRRFTGYPLAMS